MCHGIPGPPTVVSSSSRLDASSTSMSASVRQSWSSGGSGSRHRRSSAGGRYRDDFRARYTVRTGRHLRRRAFATTPIHGYGASGCSTATADRPACSLAGQMLHRVACPRRCRSCSVARSSASDRGSRASSAWTRCSSLPGCGCGSGSIATRCAVEADAELTLFRGATYEDPADGMFSFVPAKLASEEDPRFARPPIRIAGLVNPASWRGPSGATRPLDTATIRNAWQSLKEQVITAGLVLGVSLDTPTRRVSPGQRGNPM
jgi:hypothetical protein